MTQPTEMFALRAHERGGPEVLDYEPAPKPTPSTTEVLISVEAASITFAELDWDETWMRGGESRLPIIPSHEFCGTIAEIGSEVADWKVGDRVFGLIPFDLDGAASEFVCLDASLLTPAPLTASSAEAAATPLAALTAWQGLIDHGALMAGQRVLIHGAAGGVGIFAVQLAHRLGANVTVTARGADTEFLRNLGADRVIDFEKQAFDETSARFDLVLDPVGGDTLTRSIPVISRGGRLVTLNAPPPPDLAASFGVNAKFFIVTPNPEQLAQIAALIDEGAIRVIISATFPLSAGREAFESGAHHGRRPGKTVLVIH